MLGLTLALRGEYADARDALDRASPFLAEVDPLTPAAQSIAFAFSGRHCLGQEAELRRELGTLGGWRGRPVAPPFAATPSFCFPTLRSSGDREAAERDAEEAVAIADDFGREAHFRSRWWCVGKSTPRRARRATRARTSGGRCDRRAAGLPRHDDPGASRARLPRAGLGRTEEAVGELEETARIAAESAGWIP